MCPPWSYCSLLVVLLRLLLKQQLGYSYIGLEYMISRPTSAGGFKFVLDCSVGIPVSATVPRNLVALLLLLCVAKEFARDSNLCLRTL